MPQMSDGKSIAQNQPNSRDIGDFAQAAAARRRAEWALPMNERLARVHILCKQMSAVQDTARSR